MKFTREQWRDIEGTRARLKAWKAQFQTYPPYPEQASTLVAAPSEFWVKAQWQYAQQLRAQVLYLQGKINEHLDTSKKKRGKY